MTGLSGAGKTTAIHYMEDRGCPYVDNLPPAMVMRFIDLCVRSTPSVKTVVVAVDIRSGGLFDAFTVGNLVRGARSTGTDVRLLFLEASDEVLLNRFKETRREHPLVAEAGSLSKAIALERERMMPLREMSDVVLDTSVLKPRALQALLAEAFFTSDKDQAVRIQMQVVSFGFKRGQPRDADIVLDVRFLPNPFYINDIRFQTGLQKGVRDFVLGAPVTIEFLKKTMALLLFLIPNYEIEGKRRLVIGIGCTGGAHRSVAIAEALGEKLRMVGYRTEVTHRDIELEKENWNQL